MKPVHIVLIKPKKYFPRKPGIATQIWKTFTILPSSFTRKSVYPFVSLVFFNQIKRFGYQDDQGGPQRHGRKEKMETYRQCELKTGKK